MESMWEADDEVMCWVFTSYIIVQLIKTYIEFTLSIYTNAKFECFPYIRRWCHAF